SRQYETMFIQSAPRRSKIRTSTAEIARYSATLATLLLAEPFVDRFRCLCGPPPLSISSVSATAQAGPAAPRTAAASDVLPPAVASSNAHVLPAVLRSSP